MPASSGPASSETLNFLDQLFCSIRVIAKNDHVKRYEGKVKEGGILISVHAENNSETSSAKAIFKEEGAYDISSTGEAQDSSDGIEAGVNETLPSENIAASQVVEADKSAPKRSGDESADWAQAEREVRAEANLYKR